jgi:phosphomannomutase/phosphoglucomutase
VLDTATGVCVTGSHNPAADNGVKIVINGESLHGDRILRIHERIAEGDLVSGEGEVSQVDITSRYSHELLDDIVLARPLKVVVDCANGITGKMVPELLRDMECDVIPLYAEVDGSFPNHEPDPSQPPNLEALIARVKDEKADLGIAFDGDGDRLGVITGGGEIIWPDRLMMLFSRDLLSRSPGADILFDVKSSRELSKLISQQGGRPLMCRTGHSFMHSRMLETGAPLGGEVSGHIFFADRWYGFDDGIYAAARLLEILSLEGDDADGVFGTLQTGVSTPELIIETTDQAKFAIVEKLQAAAEGIEEGSVSTLDGLRVDFEDGWGLVRASNTRAALTARFEGNDKAALERIEGFFRDRLAAAEPQLKVSF